MIVDIICLQRKRLFALVIPTTIKASWMIRIDFDYRGLDGQLPQKGDPSFQPNLPALVRRITIHSIHSLNHHRCNPSWPCMSISVYLQQCSRFPNATSNETCIPARLAHYNNMSPALMLLFY
ncbi:hypothetical protein JTE90_008777 [Oedothorax gibbosus]|uniref:Uncharacterized protein n=1 Tax=Oedothorax gibbosus TaxID=931172 RepID=A0AAV6V523_9ARAC|nr:hypothetical protein JTE90_008777 [Oedothorax gibbosus]